MATTEVFKTRVTDVVAFNRAMAVLNEALKAEPTALMELLTKRVHIGHTLDTHPDVITGGSEEAPSLSPLGLINSVLLAATGKRVALGLDEKGNPIAFTDYEAATKIITKPEA